ncbi:tRNA splicing endonuclease subunit sen2 [Coemansia sp. 'formosensis']|nr:tRNA splicing endonuclease subunit sen2 [Coemansia sp. 'formosensis']
MDTVEGVADKPPQARWPNNRKAKRLYEPLPMVRQSAILPRVGQLLDHINQLLLRINPLPSYLPRISRLIRNIWSASTQPLQRLFYALTPGNLFWPTLVSAQIQATIHLIRNEQTVVDCFVWVPTEWTLLWQKGAFGKGILSRSEPTWLPRFTRGQTTSVSGKFLEDITRQRRGERQAARETETKDKESALGLTLIPIPSLPVTPEEAQVMESMQLSFHETLFLCEMGCLQVRDPEGTEYSHEALWHLFCEIDRSSDFALKHAAYYYYRSKGWVVRSGLKFGSDFLLYTKGPANSHAQYSVVVRRCSQEQADGVGDEGEPRDASESWQFMFSLSRVTSQVRKTLVLCYVDPPAAIDAESAEGHMPADLKEYKVREFIVKRFNANRM